MDERRKQYFAQELCSRKNNFIKNKAVLLRFFRGRPLSVFRARWVLDGATEAVFGGVMELFAAHKAHGNERVAGRKTHGDERVAGE